MGQFNTIPPNPFPPTSEKVGDAVKIEKDIASIKEDITSLENDVDSLRSGLTNLLKYVDITVTDTITLTANIPAYRDYPQTGIPDGSALIGVRLLSATGDALDGNVGAYLGAFNFIHLLSTINKSFTSITFRIYFYGGT